MSVVISVRVDDNTRDIIEEMGFTPSEYIRMLLDRELKRERSKRTLEWLRKNRIPGTGLSSTEMIRRDRDSR